MFHGRATRIALVGAGTLLALVVLAAAAQASHSPATISSPQPNENLSRATPILFNGSANVGDCTGASSTWAIADQMFASSGNASAVTHTFPRGSALGTQNATFTVSYTGRVASGAGHCTNSPSTLTRTFSLVNSPPTVTGVSGPSTVEAGSAATFAVSASDADSGSSAATAIRGYRAAIGAEALRPEQASSSISLDFPTPGARNVTFVAIDQDGGVSPAFVVLVNVVDTTAPVIAYAPSIGPIEATGPAGAVVTFDAPLSYDAVDGVVPTTCAPASGSTFPIALTLVTCERTDSSGNVATPRSFVVSVRDTTPPTIDAAATLEPVEATGPAGAVVTFSAPLARDIVDGDFAATCSPASGSVFPLGVTEVTCEAVDANGNTAAPVGFSVAVVDTVAPSLTLDGPESYEATSAAGAAILFEAYASDAVDGAPAITCDALVGDVFPLGTHTVTCAAEDASGNVGSATYTFRVVDTTAPVIAAAADLLVEATGADGAIVAFDAPATSDAVDGDGLATCAPSSGGLFALGETLVTCSATDAAGNVADPVSFVVIVADTTAPVIAPVEDIVVEAVDANGAIVAFDAPATTDAVDGDGVATCDPLSGTLFPLGETLVACDAVDAAGNAAPTATFRVRVVDTTAPVIAAVEDVAVAAASADGSVVAFDAPATTDAVDGDGIATCTPASGSLFPLGETLVTCVAQDAAGNVAAPVSFVVRVTDDAAPVIDAAADIVAEAQSAAGAVVLYDAPATTDAIDGAGVATCAPASGSLFPLGDTLVTCDATDAAGNSASRSFTVSV
ncbi:MAG TPA: HYR domain-containing protein, partial [Candidatus Thermoplasmatota archaeon]|nr:HYR domain-containing protein [Candidatus Thermoplasmatota archaeon]